MIILLKNNLNCEKVCKAINEYLSRELKNTKDLSNYALTLNLTEIKEYKEIKLIEK